MDFNKATPNPVFEYFSTLMERDVLDAQGNWVGDLYDIIVKVAQIYPQSDGLVIRKGFINHKYAYISWQDVAEVGKKEIRLKICPEKIIFAEKRDNKDELSLRRDVLDQQVVDTYNHKVIRVNDVHFLRVENSYTVAHVDIGGRGLVRRLGFEKLVDFCIRLFTRARIILNLNA